VPARQYEKRRWERNDSPTLLEIQLRRFREGLPLS
jgi:hypothetical protein